MTKAPRLFDPDLVALHRARAAAEGHQADFLHQAVLDETLERLNEVNRTFHAPVVIGPRPELWSEGMARAGLARPRCLPEAEVLDLPPRSADLVVHALALHWANDLVGQLVQARHALRPDGLCLAIAFGAGTLVELRAALAQAEAEVTGGISPRIAPLAGLRDLGSLLQRAGFALPVADAWRLEVEYADAFHLMRDLRAMGETNAMVARLRRPTRRQVFLRAAELYATAYPAQDGRVRASFELVVLTGWAPAGTQQQPLRPGTAARRLADALGTKEHGTGIKPAGP